PILHANQPLSRATICPSSNGAPRCHLEGRAVCAPKDLNAHPENSLARFSPIWEAAPGTLKLQGYDRCRKHHHALRLAHPLRDVTTTFMAGRRYAISGPNGAGKSTFMKILTGEQDPTSGTVTRPKRMGVLRQDQFAFDKFRALDTVIMGNATLWKALEEREV